MTLFVRASYRGQVVELNFSSFTFDNFLKIISFPVSLVIYKEDALLMMYYHKTFITLIKTQIVANEFVNLYQMQSPVIFCKNCS